MGQTTQDVNRPSEAAAPAPSLDFSATKRALGDRIRERRKALGMSQEGLAGRSDVHWTFVGQVERGQRNLNLHNLLKLARGLDIDAGELVRGLLPAVPDRRVDRGA